MTLMRRGETYILAGLVLALICAWSGTVLAAGIDNPDPVYTLAKWHGTDVIQGELLVKFKEGSSQAAREALHARLGGSAVRTVAKNLVRVQLNDDERSLDAAMADYSDDANVVYAEPNRVYWPTAEVDDPKFIGQWGMKKINCPKAWNFTQGDHSMVVAVIDTGADLDHPDLDEHYAYGYDFYANDPNPDDIAGHGSHTSGIAAAETNNGIGVAGVGYNCRFAAYRTGNYYLLDSAIVSSIYDAMSQGAMVISMSFGSNSPGSSIENALNDAYAAGIVCVASAGNANNTKKKYPAAYPNVIAVASTNLNDGRSTFSTYGDWVDVAAPGTGIFSTYKDGKYASLQGTSMSCPHVAGQAAMIYLLLGGERNQANADEVRNMIQDTCVPVGSWVIHGRIDVHASISPYITIEPPVLTEVTPAEVKAFQGGTITLTGSNLGSVTELVSGGEVLLEGSGFSIVSNEVLKYKAPNATSLGPQEVVVTNPEGTSNSIYFDYIETSPVKMTVPFLIKEGSVCCWDYAGGAYHGFAVLLGTDPATFSYKGFNIMADFHMVACGVLNEVGIGLLEGMVTPGLQGQTFYSQFVTFGPDVFDATGLRMTTIIP
ncbi:MAG: S8 family serine peptidase [Planctomycetota bacterium]|jgi:thermitase